MAKGELTIRDPLGQIPDLVLIAIADGYNRSFAQQITLAEFTQSGNPVLKGAYGQGRYIWEVAVTLTALDALHWQALFSAQQERYSALGAGHLLLIDEVELLIPRTAQLPIVAGTAITLFGKPSGYGVVPVVLAIDDKFIEHVGRNATGDEHIKRIAFKAIEVRS